MKLDDDELNTLEEDASHDEGMLAGDTRLRLIAELRRERKKVTQARKDLAWFLESEPESHNKGPLCAPNKYCHACYARNALDKIREDG